MNNKIFSMLASVQVGNIIVQNGRLNATDTAINRILDKFSMKSYQLNLNSMKIV